MDLESGPNVVLKFAEGHPYVLLAAVIVLIIIVLIMLISPTSMPKLPSLCKRKKPPLDSEDEVDKLIESIHNKQKR